MKQTKVLFLTMVLTLTAFAGVMYTSCKKDPCAGVDCLNGGACSNGNCICPSGYTGANCENLATTEIDYYNNTFTPVYITINGVSSAIPVGSYVAYSGYYGDAATGTAYTYGASSSGSQIGLSISWNLSDYFPASSKEVDINVSSDYFFLKIENNSSVNITTVIVNDGLSSQTQDNITIPNTGIVYTVGYYDAWTNSNLYLTSASRYWSYNISLPFTENQTYTFVAGN